MILDAPNWDEMHELRLRWGFVCAIVYQQQPNVPACTHRLRVKEFATQRWGKPLHLNYRKVWTNTDGVWLTASLEDYQYTIAFKSTSIRDWLLMI
jgi:hypothetical protein